MDPTDENQDTGKAARGGKPGYKVITKCDSSKNDKKHSTTLWILVGGMFFLRIPFLAGIRTFAPAAETWAAPVFEVGTYLLISLAIWWERRNLADCAFGGSYAGLASLAVALDRHQHAGARLL